MRSIEISLSDMYDYSVEDRKWFEGSTAAIDLYVSEIDDVGRYITVESYGKERVLQLLDIRYRFVGIACYIDYIFDLLPEGFELGDRYFYICFSGRGQSGVTITKTSGGLFVNREKFVEGIENDHGLTEVVIAFIKEISYRDYKVFMYEKESNKED